MLYPTELRAHGVRISVRAARRHRLIAAVALVLLAATPAAATCRATSGATLGCDDGARLRLDGVLDDAAPAVLDAALAAGGWAVVPLGPPDRSGHVPVRVDLRGGASLQAVLVGRGAARVWPGVDGDLARTLYAAEDLAREARRGRWAADWGVLAAVPPPDATGGFAIIRGEVLSSGETRRYGYLNFGRAYREDTTVRVRRDDARDWGWWGELERFVGGRVEARGALFERGGPMLELDDPLQLRRLD